MSVVQLLPAILVNGLLPFLIFKGLTRYTPLSEIAALGISAIVPTVNGVVGIWRRRQIDFIAILVLVGIVVSITALLLGGGPRLFLIRESFVTAALGVVALSSFAWRRPLLFYIGRQFSTAGQDAAAIDRFNGLWEIPGARRTFRIMTLVWAVGWLLEFAIRVLMVMNLSTGQVLAISPFVFNGITLGLLAWTFAYARRRQHRAAGPQHVR